MSIIKFVDEKTGGTFFSIIHYRTQWKIYF